MTHGLVDDRMGMGEENYSFSTSSTNGPFDSSPTSSWTETMDVD